MTRPQVGLSSKPKVNHDPSLIRNLSPQIERFIRSVKDGCLHRLALFGEAPLLSADGAAFRYRVPGTGARRAGGEPTAWQLPPAARVWFQTSTTSYEGTYRSARADAVPAEEKDEKGVARRVHLGPPATVCHEDGASGSLPEAEPATLTLDLTAPPGAAKAKAVTGYRCHRPSWTSPIK